MKMRRALFAFCLVAFGPVFVRSAAAAGFEKLPGEQGKTSPLLMRIVQYAGSTNGAITVEVKNPTVQAQEFSAKGIYFVPAGNPNEAPQRLGAVGPFRLQSSNGASQRMDHTTIAAGATARMTLDVYCIDSHRASPSSSTSFRVAKERAPKPLVQSIDADATRAAAAYGGVSAPAAKSAPCSRRSGRTGIRSGSGWMGRGRRRRRNRVADSTPRETGDGKRGTGNGKRRGIRADPAFPVPGFRFPVSRLPFPISLHQRPGFRLDPERHRAIVHQLHRHVRAEPPGRHNQSTGAKVLGDA